MTSLHTWQAEGSISGGVREVSCHPFHSPQPPNLTKAEPKQTHGATKTKQKIIHFYLQFLNSSLILLNTQLRNANDASSKHHAE